MNKNRTGLLFGLLAAAWLAVGALSTNTHGLPTHAWVLITGAAAGSALAVVNYQSRFALRIHMLIVTGAALISAISLAEVGRYRATAVWCIIVVQAYIVGRYAIQRRQAES